MNLHPFQAHSVVEALRTRQFLAATLQPVGVEAGVGCSAPRWARLSPFTVQGAQG